ncbi:hypothetical protein PFZ49_16545, partial [Microbacterium lacticum]|uniref:hypothetical protein n=1 Tax=Microbacterium lacticum TaxID=33885 RepID=UPI003A8B3691
RIVGLSRRAPRARMLAASSVAPATATGAPVEPEHVASDPLGPEPLASDPVESAPTDREGDES